jgi:hypothetical protein
MTLTQGAVTGIIASIFPTSTTAGSIVLTASFAATAAAATAAFSTTPASTVFASDSPFTSTGSTTTTYQVANPINVYSFALQPEEHQPSGTCNFSRIDTTTLVFDSFKTGTYPTKSRPFNFRIYAVNYNIFRVMSGMGGLAYSN